MSLLITGFGPFSSFDSNPSEILAVRLSAQLGCAHRIVEVAFDAVEEFMEDPVWKDVDRVLLMGVAGGRKKLSMEMFAHNGIGAAPDVRGVERPGPIRPGGPAILGGTLFPAKAPSKAFRLTFDPGRYLCNYIYYRALERRPEHRIGFLHVTPESAIAVDAQAEEILALINGCLGSELPARPERTPLAPDAH